MVVCRKSPQVRATIVAPKVFISGDQYYSYLYGSSCSYVLPALRYNKALHKWEFSHDGTNYYILGTGGGSGSGDDSIKIVEVLNSQVLADVDHILPGAMSYTLSSGSKLDVYLNGQILNHDQLAQEHDYKETAVNKIRFHFVVPKDTALTYIIK